MITDTRRIVPAEFIATLNGWPVQSLGSISWHQDWMPIHCETRNPAWRHTDKAGHEHYAHGEIEHVTYPTLKVVHETAWSDLYDEEYETSHFECLLCSEEITPRMMDYRKSIATGPPRGTASDIVMPLYNSADEWWKLPGSRGELVIVDTTRELTQVYRGVITRIERQLNLSAQTIVTCDIDLDSSEGQSARRTEVRQNNL